MGRARSSWRVCYESLFALLRRTLSSCCLLQLVSSPPPARVWPIGPLLMLSELLVPVQSLSQYLPLATSLSLTPPHLTRSQSLPCPALCPTLAGRLLLSYICFFQHKLWSIVEAE
ncbi:hypothetical protein CRG98_038677 [Punica granatum]|uniref:Uncharacterized protein n=1 Tax=Punica granatum TaxID=22663 RepID=A0A2I0IB89_PUNGR|nr:hypothetical protein CRG98_038677 [Punica granatum]